MLYIVATPIGNLKDVSFRAVEVLKSVAVIACEDTRHTRILLDHYAVTTPTTSYFQHSKFSKGEYLLALLKQGKDVALVSDAGTPGLLDPGFHLINACIEDRIPMTVIPGPTALVNALVLSGKPAHKFIFEGFLPVKSLARRNRLKKLMALKYTVVFYESCHRILKTLQDLEQVCADKEIVVVRELTKKFEEVIRAKPSVILAKFQKEKPRGEFIVVM